MDDSKRIPPKDRSRTGSLSGLFAAPFLVMLMELAVFGTMRFFAWFMRFARAILFD